MSHISMTAYITLGPNAITGAQSCYSADSQACMHVGNLVLLSLACRYLAMVWPSVSMHGKVTSYGNAQ